MSRNRKITMGRPQMTFGFDPSHEQDLKEVLALIDSKIADNDQVMLDQVATHFSIEPEQWSGTDIRDLVFDLFKEDKLHFSIEGRKILPENFKAPSFEPAQSKSEFLKMREITSIVKIHLSEPAQWKYIEIIKPEVVKEPVLLKAHCLGNKLFKDVGRVRQNSLCKNLRRHLRIWKSGLEGFREVGKTGNYPGKNEIQEGLDLLNKLLSVHDPCKFIETFLNNEDRLCDAASYWAIFENFYKNQLHVWNTLLAALEDFNPNRTVLEEDPDVKKALATLCQIVKDPEPYSLIKEISDLISIVKAANDPVVEKQTASAKALAVEKIEKKIEKVVNVLDEKKASGDVRNKALFPLQTIQNKINAASNIQSIADFLDEAIDQFDNAMDRLG